MSRKVDSKSRHTIESKAVTSADKCGNRVAGPHSSRSSGTSGDMAPLERTLDLEHMHISHNYMIPYQKPQWYGPSERSTIHKVHLIENLVTLDEQLQALMQSGGFLNDWKQFNNIRHGIHRQFIDLLKFEMKFCRQHNVEQHFWKILYYNAIEFTKRLASDKSNANSAFYRQKCLDVIDDGVEFFERLLGILSATYKYDLEDFIGVNAGASLKGLKYVSLAIVSAQKIFIYLGDLLRYREVITDGKNFEAVKKYYVWAQQLIPSNGMPYNQLAVLSLYNKRKFDTVYYHLRSLSTSNPIKSAKESLVVLFDEIRKKYESLQKTTSKPLEKPRRRSEHFRREIWIHPTDGQLNYRTVCLDEGDDDTEVLESNELYKRFIANYLHLHGMLFTKIGTESLEACTIEVLKEFAELLGHQSSGIMTQQKLVHLIVLNAFAINYNCGNSDETKPPSDLQADALAFAFCFFGILINKLLKEFVEIISAGFDILTQQKSNNRPILVTDVQTTDYQESDGRYNVLDVNNFALPDFVNNLLAAVLLWCNWMRCHCSMWNSVGVTPTITRLIKNFGACPWDEFATLITTFGKFGFDENLVLTEKPRPTDGGRPTQYTRLRLPEDLLVLGLSNLQQSEIFYCREEHIKARLYGVLRMKQIWEFGTKFLCACEPAVLKRSGPAEEFPAKYTACLLDNQTKRALGDNDVVGVGEMARTAGVNCLDDKSTDGYASSSNSESGAVGLGTNAAGGAINEHVREYFAEGINNDGNVDAESLSEIQKLLHRKNELERSHKLHEKHYRYTEEILRQSKNDTLLIEVRPKYLIPDTNCFISFLPQLKALAHSHPVYQILVPLVVYNELEGLAKGDRPVESSPVKGPGAQIQTRKSMGSQKALLLLHSLNKIVRCATTKGSILKSMSFTKECDNVEHEAEHLNNDDKILLTAANLSQLYCGNRDFMNAPHPSRRQSSGIATGGATNAVDQSAMQRQVVLLTNDRNLKVKAIAQNIPVREVSDFVKWAGITY